MVFFIFWVKEKRANLFIDDKKRSASFFFLSSTAKGYKGDKGDKKDKGYGALLKCILFIFF